MKAQFFLIAVLSLTCLSSSADDSVDSYLKAYMDSKYQDQKTQVVYSKPMVESSSPSSGYAAFEITQNEVENEDANTNSDSSKIPPSTSYGVPDLNQTYRIAEIQPREPITQRPLPQYGPPKFYYSPSLKPIYGPPLQYGPPPTMEVSRMPMMLSNFQGLAHQFLESPDTLKLFIVTALKVFLKLLVFKFIVKFFVMIGLLLIIPKFDMGSMDSMMGDDKNKSRTFSDENLDSLTKFVEDSFEAFRSGGGSIFPSCTEEAEGGDSNVKLFCELKRSANSLNDQFSFSKLFPGFLVPYLERLQREET